MLVTNFLQVKKAGYISRKLTLLCMNTLLDYNIEDCGSTEYINIDIKDKKVLDRLHGRWYLNEETNELNKVDIDNESSKELIGKVLKFRSSITCQGHDKKICRTCYGELADLNYNIHIGKLGADILTEQLTQMLLSTKHLLKTFSEDIDWGKVMSAFFKFDSNTISPAIEYTNKHHLVFNIDEIDEFLEEKMEISIKNLTIVNDDKEYKIKLPKELFMSNSLQEVLIDKGDRNEDEGTITLCMKDIEPDEILFYFIMNNNELSSHLANIQTLIESKDHLGITNKHDMVNEFTNLLNNSGIRIDLIHIENIVRELLRDMNKVSERNYIDGEYVILRLSDAIMNSPSIVNSLSFEQIKKQFLNPSTYSKTDSSYLDVMFI